MKAQARNQPMRRTILTARLLVLLLGAIFVASRAAERSDRNDKATGAVIVVN